MKGRAYPDLVRELVPLYEGLMAESAAIAADDPEQVAATLERLDAMGFPRSPWTVNNDPHVFRNDMRRQTLEFRHALKILSQGQNVIFSRDQAAFFIDEKRNTRPLERLPYRLPFTMTILQFDHPLPVQMYWGADTLRALLLDQLQLSRSDYIHQYISEIRRFPGIKPYPDPPPGAQDCWINSIIAVFGDNNVTRYTWAFFDEDVNEIEVTQSNEPAIAGEWKILRRLAVCCVAYIHCTNIQLKKVDFTMPPKVLAKREKKGKRTTPPAPYYLIEVQHTYQPARARGEPSGRHVGYRFPVTGFFRHYPHDPGRLLWIADHERGLAHATYVPQRRIVK